MTSKVEDLGSASSKRRGPSPERIKARSTTFFASGWRISGPDGAAAQLGMPASRLKSRLKALGVDKPEPSSLYVRLGGSRGIATFARDLFGRAMAHPQGSAAMLIEQEGA